MIKIGSHVKFKSPNYMVDSLKESLKNGANSAMIFIGPPQSSRRVEVERYQKQEYYDQYAKIIPPERIVVHGPYIVNLSSPEKFGFAIEFICTEIARMNYLGLKYLVLHPGASTKFSKEESIATLIKSLKAILSKTIGVEILIETMSGKGTENITTFGAMKYLLDEVDSPRIGVCLDTCHVWDAGYNLQDFDNFIKEYASFNLIERTKVIHVNDSKNDLGAHKDRHENIGLGKIGLEALRRIVNAKELMHAIKILETPIPKSGSIYDAEIKMLISV